jgi:CRP-like cAMP-binding protein
MTPLMLGRAASFRSYEVGDPKCLALSFICYGESPPMTNKDVLYGANFKATFSQFGDLTAEAASGLNALLRERKFSRGEWLLRAGEIAEWSHFIVRGLVREFYVASDGAEHTRSFIAEGRFTGSLIDLISGQPAITWIEALEPTETLSFSYREFERICQSHPSLLQFSKRVLERLLVTKVRREYELLSLPAGLRYANWMNENSQLDRRVRRKDLASYLGVTPEHLSRLRRRQRRSAP